ncbi:DUF4124 domain-containing protein [Kistimonas scapharcae]
MTVRQLPWLVLLSVLLSPFAHGEVYRWKDSNGVIHFTDKPVSQSQAVKTTTRSLSAEEWLQAIQGSWKRTGSTPTQQELALKVLTFFEDIPAEYNFPEKVVETLTIADTNVILEGTAYSTNQGVGRESTYHAEGRLSLDEGSGKEGRFLFQRGRNPYMEDFTLLLLLNLLDRQDMKGTEAIQLQLDGDRMSVTITPPDSVGVSRFTIRYQRLKP